MRLMQTFQNKLFFQNKTCSTLHSHKILIMPLEQGPDPKVGCNPPVENHWYHLINLPIELIFDVFS